MPSSSSTEQEALPRVFILELTSQCNHRCLYCYAVWNGSEVRPPPARPMVRCPLPR